MFKPLNCSFSPEHLLVIKDSQSQQAITLLDKTYSLGRHRGNSIVLSSSFVSQKHAVLLRIQIPNTQQFYYRIIDGDLTGKRSTNGLQINHIPHYSHDLRHGDIIQFAPQIHGIYYCFSLYSNWKAAGRKCDDEILSSDPWDSESGTLPSIKLGHENAGEIVQCC